MPWEVLLWRQRRKTPSWKRTVTTASRLGSTQWLSVNFFLIREASHGGAQHPVSVFADKILRLSLVFSYINIKDTAQGQLDLKKWRKQTLFSSQGICLPLQPWPDFCHNFPITTPLLVMKSRRILSLRINEFKSIDAFLLLVFWVKEPFPAHLKYQRTSASTCWSLGR